MNSFDILSKETVIPSRLFLEASAGTGKTFTIEHLVVRLLLETSLRLEEIVIVTFTRAATRELRERIRQNLAQIVDDARLNKRYSLPYLQETSLHKLQKIEEALHRFEEAQIFTIHGFCAHLLHQSAFEAGTFLSLAEWNRQEEIGELKQFLRSTKALSSGELERLLRFYRFEMNNLEEALLHFSEKREVLSLTLPSLKGIDYFPVAEHFEEIRSSYKGMTFELFSQQAQQLEEALQKGVIEEPLWEEWISSSQFFLKNMVPAQLKVRAKTCCSHELTQLRELIVPTLESAQSREYLLAKLSSAWHAHRKQASLLQGKITPDDLLTLVHANLKNVEFTTAVRKQYRAVIVDEFQDTDPIQWNIFKTLFIEDPQIVVYLVGDPKQSIYAFRLADIYTFLEAASFFGMEQKGALLRNFRSTSGLLHQVNKLLCHTPWMDLPKESRFLEIPQALAAQEGEGALIFMIGQEMNEKSILFPSSQVEETQLFPFIVEEIQNKNLSLDSMAILVKDRYQAERIRQFLERWKIPATVSRSSALSDSPVIEFLEELFQATMTLSSASVRNFLVGPFARVPLYQLTPDLVFKTKKELEGLREVWKEEGFATFFASFLNTSFGTHSAWQTFYEQANNADDLLEITQKVLLTHTPHELIEKLKEIKTFETKDRISKITEGIQIMTIHASKGLEFETVFALGLASRSPSQELSAERLQELDAEKMRQFYVAVTRAAKRLYIPLVHEIPAPFYALGEGSPVELFFAKTQINLKEFQQEILSNRSFHLHLPPESVISPPPPLSFQNPFPPRFILSFSSIAQEQFTPFKNMEHTLPVGAETGIIVHKILERYFNQEGGMDDLVIQETCRTPLALHAATLQTLLKNALALSLGSFCLNDVSFSSVQTEMEFLYSNPQGLMKGFIDLVFEHQGKVYVVDWKTNLLEKWDLATLRQAMESHDYILQGHIYAEAMKQYLGGANALAFGGVYFIFIRGPAYFYV